MKRPWAIAALVAGLAAALLLRDGAAPDPARGRLLYLRGVDAAGGRLVGRLAAGAQLEGALAACARCHGPGGGGSREGGIAAPPIDARSLRSRALDDEVLAAAVAEGRRQDGTPLDGAMPRYALSARDRRDLFAFLRTLGEALDPGVGEEAVRVGAIAGGEARAVLEAFFARVNERGGIHRRRIELAVVAPAEAAAMLERGELFALVGGELPPAVRPLVEREGIPVVAPIGVRWEAPTVFHLYPTAEELARVAVQEILRAQPPPRPLLVHAEDEGGLAWLRGARAEATRRGAAPLATFGYPPERFDPAAAVEAIRVAGADVILFSGDEDALLQLDRALGGAAVAVHAPISAAPRVPSRGSGRLFFWSPTLLGTEASEGLGAFHAFLRTNGITPSRNPVQHHAYAAARLFAEALRIAGAPPTRAGLVEALESLDRFPTGVTPPVTFGRYRRSGIRGAHLLAADPRERRLVPVAAWAELAPP